MSEVIPDEAVEAAARVMVGERNWQAHSVTWCNDYLEDMRAALEAAAPYMQTMTNQEDA